jgi:hypothetical protein
MHTAEEVSIGGRMQVLEDGNDVCDSESDSESEGHGDELTGCNKGIPENFCSGNVYSETMPTNVIIYWAVSEGVTLQGGEPRCSQPSLGGLTK